MTFDPVAGLMAYHAALDGRDYAALAKLLSPEARYHSEGIGELKGRDAILATVRKYFDALPDQQAWDDAVIKVSEHMAQCQWHLRATNTETGAVVERRGLETVTFNESGEVVSVVVEDWE